MSMGTLAMVAESVGGVLHGKDRSFAAISTDTRTLGADELFIALRGPNHDAATFVADAERQGAAGVVVDRRLDSALPQIVVGNTREALANFARRWRDGFDGPVIGVTGSNGKTTVKEMCAAILRAHAGEDGAVLATRGNLNNDIGLPLMVLELRPSHRYAVFEMGASAAGEIETLAAIAKPAVGIVTNAGPAHLEGFGSLQGVARAKGEIFAALPRDGTAIINRDDDFYADWLDRCPGCRTLSFGLAPHADVRATDIRENGSSMEFTLHLPGTHFPVNLAMAGEHNVRNALAAAAATLAAGAERGAVQQGLAAAVGVSGRLRRLESQKGAVVYDDSYNANPASLMAAIHFLARQPGETWLVLGDMKELGADSKALHAECGAAAREAGVSRLLSVGDEAAAAAAAFGQDGLGFESRDALISALSSELAPGVTVLVKGSRSMGMEKVVAALAGANGED